MLRCVLLSGGGGLRLWPLSRGNAPKQYVPLPDGSTLFEQALLRNAGLFDSFMVIANARYRDATAAGLARAGVDAQMVLEPVPRNTAPAIAMAALLSNPDDILLVAPTDHHVEGAGEYASAITEAARLAREGTIVVFGIKPTLPHTGYGYIKASGEDVIAFREKPDAATARAYLHEGGYLWNSGMFMFKAGTMLAELRRCRSDIHDACAAIAAGLDASSPVVELPAEAFAGVPAESIDYAVIEQAQGAKVVPATFSWSDLGGLPAFGALADSDAVGNRVLGENAIVRDGSGTTVINSAPGTLVVVNGLSNVVVTVAPDAVYVSSAGAADGIKDVIESDAAHAAWWAGESPS